MPVSSGTQFVPSSDEYTAPERPIDRIRQITAKMPRHVNANGFPIAGPDPSVVEFAEPPTAGPVPTLAQALSQAADAVVGADLQQLLDSQSFCAELGEISPSDSLGLQDVIRRHTPDPMPGMAPNRAQGASSASAPGRSSGSSADQIHALVAARLSR